MRFLPAIAQVLLLFTLFAVLHSVLASAKVKAVVASRLPALLPWYRLLYNGIALLTFGAFIQFSPKPDVTLYDLPYPYDLLVLLPQFAALGGLVWTFYHMNGSSFLGIEQAIQGLQGTYDHRQGDERLHLKVTGPYRLCRHPVYLFSILFLVFRPEMSGFYFLLVLCCIAYFYAGSVFEERKLAAHFGGAYREYQQSVPRIFPTDAPLERLLRRFLGKDGAV